MDLDQREVRRAAAKAFLDSLDQLQASLQAIDHQSSLTKSQAAVGQPVRMIDGDRSRTSSRNTSTQQNLSKSATPVTFTLQDLEMAIADIDNYIKAKAQLDQSSNPDQAD